MNNPSFGLGAPSTYSQSITPLQAQQIRQQIAQMAQMPQYNPGTPSNPFAPNSNLGANLGGMTQGFFGGPSYGGGNMFTDAYGGSAANPLPGLTAADYG